MGEARHIRTERKRVIKEQALYGLEDMNFRLMV
jgi:hypothetical protein